MASDKIETFPEEKIVNPAGKEHQMSVEETLRSCAHVKRVTKDRGGWRFLTGPEVTPESIRETYKTTPDAPIFQNILHDKTQWAVWVSEGAPEPAEGPFAAEAAAKAPIDWPDKRVAELIEIAEKIVEPQRANVPGTWRYTSCDEKTTEAEVRAKLGTTTDAPVRFHVDGDMAAAWFGSLPPNKSAFPGIGKEIVGRNPKGHYGPADPAAWLGSRTEPAPRPNPGLAGRDGMRLLKLSRNKAFSKKIRALLERVALKLLEK